MRSIGTLALHATHAAALAQALVAADPSPRARIAVMLGAAVLGAAAGLMLALALGTALGVVPRPRQVRSGRAASEHPEPPQPPAAPQPPAPAADLRSDPAVAPRERHRALYEAEYSWQERRLEALRRRIGAQLAPDTPAAGEPASGSGRGEGCKTPPKAGSTG
jgi:hypothetical protein